MNLAAYVLVSNGARLAAIWLLLIALAIAALIELSAEPRQGFLGRLAASLGEHLDLRRELRIRAAEQAADAARYAREIAVVAEAATVTVQRRREQWHDAQQRLDGAWTDFQDAEERVTAARRVAAFDTYAVAFLPCQLPSRERYLRTAATAAHRRGDLTGHQLISAMLHRDGWDPALHPADQDVVLARAGRDNQQQAYQRAVAAERAAWHEAEIAVVAARALRHEAALAGQVVVATRPRRALLGVTTRFGRVPAASH